MQNKTINANVHRFNDHVAISIGDGKTLYLTPKDAAILARSLKDFSDDCNTIKFTNSCKWPESFHFEGKES